MSVEHLDVLHAELPELFQTRELSPTWDDDLIIVPIKDPEWVGDQEAVGLAPARIDESFISSIELENWAADIEPMTVAPLAAPGGVPTLPSVILDVLGGTHAGAPIPYVDQSKMPPPDCHAFYLPFHYYHPT